MSWAIVAVAGAAALSAGVATSQANKQKKAVGNSLNDTIAYARRNPDMFGEKLDFEGVDYSPLFREDPGYGNLAGDVTAGNRRNLPSILELTSDTNEGITANSVNRINTLYPGFQDAFTQQAQNTQNFLRGSIPQEDRDMITARRSEAISLGGGGNTGQQVAADLGLTRLDLMKQGAADLTNNAALLNMIDPISRHLTPQSSFVDVGQAINSAVSENQFAAQFAASERDSELNYALIPDPQKAGLQNLLAQRAGLQAANQQQSVLLNAGVAGVSAAANAYAGQQTSAARQNQAVSMQGQGSYVAPAQGSNINVGYASAGDRSAGIHTLGGEGTSYASTPYRTPYNANTGASFGDQGGLWSYYNRPSR